MAKLSKKKIQQVEAMIDEGVSHRKISKECSVSVGMVSNIRRQRDCRGKGKCDASYDNKSGVVSVRTTHINTLEKALEYAKVDDDIWEVDRYVVNSWEVTLKDGNRNPKTVMNYQVKVWLKRKSPEVCSIESLLEEVADKSPVIEKFKVPQAKVQRSLEVSVMDPHLGLRCHRPGADQAWSIEQCKDTVKAMIEYILQDAEPHGPYKEIVLPFGNDFLHADNVFHTTTAGTAQPEAEQWQHVYTEGCNLAIWMVSRLSQVCPVKVLVVPGNHDRQSTYSMGMFLDAWFRNNKNITVDASASPYKFYHFGKCLIGYEHGHSIRQQVRLAALMANEQPEAWVATKGGYREWHIGDQHRKGSGKPSMLEEQGVSVEFLPGLTPPNEWHRLKSYNWQKRAAMGFVYDYAGGLINRLQVNISSDTGKIMRPAC